LPVIRQHTIFKRGAFMTPIDERDTKGAMGDLEHPEG
jgi:hypothetical protein